MSDRPSGETWRRWLAGVGSCLAAGIARELRSWRVTRTLQTAQPQDPDILPNPWLSY